MKIVTIVGARPQFIKAAPVSRALRVNNTEILVNTGQHYDRDMAGIFFDELGIPAPDHNLAVGSAGHGVQTGLMLAAIESLLLDERPDAVLVYGDTNSTLAGALAAAKLAVPVAHVEAGLRSFRKSMPEEINRVLTDHLSTWLFAPSAAAKLRLEREGIDNGVHVVGDVMYDAILSFAGRLRRVSPYPDALGLREKEYILCTIHRAENTDDPSRLASLFETLGRLPAGVVLPLHPRTKKKLAEFGIVPGKNVVLTPPVGYADMLRLQQAASCVLTDSGGVQKEAYYLEVPCVTLREETEWTETVDAGWNTLAGADAALILSAVERAGGSLPPHPALYGSGDASRLIGGILSQVCAEA